MIYANLLIGIFNLIPIYPLDGGRILRAVLNKFYDYKIIDEVSNNISNVTMVLLTVIASIGTLYLKNISILCIIIYLWVIRIAENKRHRLKMRLHNIIEKEKQVCNTNVKID